VNRNRMEKAPRCHHHRHHSSSLHYHPLIKPNILLLDYYLFSPYKSLLPNHPTPTMASKTLLVVGSGPGIGRAVATLFASKGYHNVVLIARRADSLASEKTAVEEAVGTQVNVRTYPVDITDPAALGKALDDADAAFGKPECVFFNAARVLPSAFFEHDVKEIEYDLKVCFPSPWMIWTQNAHA